MIIQMRILFLSRWFPYPPNNGSKLRIYNLLRGLSREHDVTLISFTSKSPSGNDQPVTERVLAELKGLCTDVQVVPYQPYNPTSTRALLGFVSPTPRSVIDTYVPQMESTIRRELDSGQYDLVIASERDTADYWPAFRNMPAIFEDIELGIFEARKAQARTLLHRLRHELTGLKLKFYLRRLLPHFGATTVVSNVEANLLRGMVPGYQSIEVIPNGVNLNEYADICPVVQPNTLIFTGSFSFSPNYEAMVWFLREVFPRVQAKVPSVRLTITGDHANRPLPPADQVTLTGFVDDVRPLIANSYISLAPIRFGGGTRLKILEAMALRTPVVATSKGAEGLDVQHNEHLLIADTPEAHAEAILRLLQEPGLRQRLADKAYQLVRQKYDWSVVTPRLLDLVERVGGAS